MSGPARKLSGRGERFFSFSPDTFPVSVLSEYGSTSLETTSGVKITSSSHFTSTRISQPEAISEKQILRTKASPSPAYLVLEDGTVFEGLACGAAGEAQGEIVFNTALTGYQEILTDPSYRGQIVVMTYPLIGNTGVNLEDIESHRPWVEGFVVREMARLHSNWRATESLPDYLRRYQIPAIEGIDTRRLVKIIREGGAQRALLTTFISNPQTLRQRVSQVPSIVGTDLVRGVTCSKPYQFGEGLYVWPDGYIKKAAQRFRVVVVDYGVKRNILRSLTAAGAGVFVVPATSSSEEILSFRPDGLLLSNGPGDPEPLEYAIRTIRSLIGRLPIFGICLGHQLLALALGAKTYKLKFGHHGANHPVKNLKTGEVEITSQNHGFAVNQETLPRSAILTHINLNDGTIEGIAYPDLAAFSVQYHPESSPGPHDAHYLFSEFIGLMNKFWGKANAAAE
ncbi:MAG: glutamine-hydrolyzing carbamoyl-phosphate synthase small subunit [Candidatus Aminicenantales bacterium]